MEFVLPNDMLVKADLMSMAHGLEIRSPFLDFELVNFAGKLPGDFKVKRNKRKRILQDTFREMLPARCDYCLLFETGMKRSVKCFVFIIPAKELIGAIAG